MTTTSGINEEDRLDLLDPAAEPTLVPTAVAVAVDGPLVVDGEASVNPSITSSVAAGPGESVGAKPSNSSIEPDLRLDLRLETAEALILVGLLPVTGD